MADERELRPILPPTDRWIVTLLAAVLAVLPAVSVVLAGWSDRLEPAPWIALLGVLAGSMLGYTRLRTVACHALGMIGGLVGVTVLYASFLPNAAVVERIATFVRRVTDWLAAAYSGGASTDNLLFAYGMALLAWLLGYVAGWSVARTLTGWWAVVPTAAALLLNLSYAPPEHLPLLYLHLVASFALLVQVNWLARTARWRGEEVEFGLQRGTPYALANIGVAIAIIFAAWRMPVGQVSRGVATAWENVAGPWQTVQTNFDRLFASLNPSPMASRGLTVAQTMAPRGSFELGDDPVMRVMGRDAAYWRAATYDRYTGRAMTTTQTTGERLERRQPLDGTMDADEGRKFVEYSVTMLAPSTSVIYAPDSPVTVSVPTVYEYRADRRDFALLRPMAPVHEQQRYSVLAAVTSASIAELKQAGTVYPEWTRRYRELPVELPDQVRRESWRVVGDATNAYDAAAAIEQYLRGMTYSTKVPVPPSNQDWVSFLLFNSREGYCDYFSTAMTVMLRGVGIPARVASGYVTGDWDPMTQSYLVTERHAHTWTEVYFPRYGWVPFEPSASRPLPARVEAPAPPLTDEDWLRNLDTDPSLDFFPDDEDIFESGGVVVLPPQQTGPGFSPGVTALMLLAVLLGIGLLATTFLWFRGIGGLPLFARPYAQIVRLATWCGFGPARAHTPYEYAAALSRAVPAAAQPLTTITEAYVAGRYGGRPTDGGGQLKAAGAEARRVLLRSLATGRARGWLRDRIRELVARRQ
jgi:transglutaminase-like putative cysteine protease